MKLIYRKSKWLHYAVIVLLFTAANTIAQEKPPIEVVTDSTKVSFSRSMPFSAAIKALSEISARLEKKIIIDPLQRTNEIGVDIENLPWRKALDLIATVNGVQLDEANNYIQIISATTVTPLVQQAQSGGGQLAANIRPVTKNLREITISATFFEADRKMLREIGINWWFYNRNGNTEYDAGQNTVGARSSDDVGVFEISRVTNDKQYSALVKALESNDVGEVIANPSITVADGREGRVQIGQDFSIKQRDFSGNVIDVFVSSGIILTVTPVILTEDSLNYVHLDVQVERSSAIPGAISTIINKTQAETELLLNNGEKAGIGGLYLTEESTTRKGIPFLRNIPKKFLGLGYLFGYDKISKNEKELIILLQADIVPTLEERLAKMKEDGR